jgi:hypothetical protein
MTWFDKLVTTATEQLSALLPANPVNAAVEFMSEAVAQKIRDEACAKAYALLAKAHRSVITTIVWQNTLLLLSLLPVYFLHSPVPFYLAYAVVAGYSVYSVVGHWPLVKRLATTRSVTQTLSAEVLNALNKELNQREFYERKAIEWLGADLKKIADDVARKLKPDVVAAVSNMAITLFLAFVAFRLFVIPMLEQRALQ